MWRLIWFLQGYVQAELRGASPEWALERLSNARVAFLRVLRIDDFTIALLILRKDVLKAEAAARKAMCELAVVREMGLSDGSACAGGSSGDGVGFSVRTAGVGSVWTSGTGAGSTSTRQSVGADAFL